MAPPSEYDLAYDSGVEDNGCVDDDDDDDRRRISPFSLDSGVSSGSNNSDSSQKPLLLKSEQDKCYSRNTERPFKGPPREKDHADIYLIQVKDHEPKLSTDRNTKQSYNRPLLEITENKDNNLPDIEKPGLSDTERDLETQTKQLCDNILRDKPFLVKVTVIFFILDILLLATVLVVSFGLPCVDNSTPNLPSSAEYCLKCSDVYLTQDDMIDNIYNFNKKEDECCSNNKTYIMHKYVHKRYRSDLALASTKRKYPTKTALHLELDREDENSITGGSNQVLKWNKTNALVAGDLRLLTDGTLIQTSRSGLYFIYAKVMFNVFKKNDERMNLGPILAQVYRMRGVESQLLLETKGTNCTSSASLCYVPSSALGVFKLEKDDKVFVNVIKPCGLVFEEKLNHFDMYLI